MTTGNTTLLGLALPVEGELDGTWGDVVNQSITELLDSAIAGTTTLSADSDVTLTDTVLSANQARQAVLLWTASNGATTRNITAPARSKAYAVINTGTGSIVLRGAGPTAGVTVIAGERCLAAWNGSDFVKIASNAVSNLTGTLPVANGGTGATTLTANNVLLGNGASGVQTVAPGTTGNVLTSNGTTWASSALPAQVYPAAGVAVSTGTAWASSLATPSGALVGTTDTQTLTNKRVTPRVSSTASITSPLAWSSDSFSQYAATAQAVNLTISADAGTPTNGQSMIFRFKDNGTPRTLTWTTGTSKSFRAIGTVLPTSTAANKTLYVGCIFNSADDRWDVIAVVQEV